MATRVVIIEMVALKIAHWTCVSSSHWTCHKVSSARLHVAIAAVLMQN